MAGNLFTKAKKSAPKTTTKVADSKPRMTVEDPTFFDKIQKLQELNDIMKSTTAQADMISDEVRTISKDKWIELYEDKGRNPGSIMVEAKNGNDTAQVMFIPQDKYITINEEKAEFLKEEYGDNIVEEQTTFSFDSSMIEKYGEVLSRLIEESDEITESDKEKIIKATTKYSVAKGTIDDLKKFGKVADVMEVVRPVVMLKGPEVIKG
jgi:hypothetical protein